jgi:hypothetical protein
MEKLVEGTVVTLSNDTGTIIGEVCGIASSEVPVLGYMYIVRIINRTGKAWDDYPYSCCVLPRNYFQLA